LVVVPASYKPTNPALQLKLGSFNKAYFNHCLVGTMAYWFLSIIPVYAAKYFPDFDTGKQILS
jgi:hypothetical protein